MNKFLVGLICCWSSLATAAPTAGVVQIDNPGQYQQVFVLSDVHGMYPALVQLLKAAAIVGPENQWAAGSTLLVIIGDSIDKGDASVDVLDLWISLTAQAPAQGGRVLHLLGNHEAELLANGKQNKKSKELFRELDRKQIKKKDFLSVSGKWGKFLRSEPVAARVGKWLFCHAGLYPQIKWMDFVSRANALIEAEKYDDDFLSGENSILEAKDWWKSKSQREELVQRLAQNGIWGVVQGHQPGAYGIKNGIGAVESGHLIKVDGGMAPEAGHHSGALLRFSKPSQMMLNQLPDLQVVSSKGKTKEFHVESLE